MLSDYQIQITPNSAIEQLSESNICEINEESTPIWDQMNAFSTGQGLKIDEEVEELNIFNTESFYIPKMGGWIEQKQLALPTAPKFAFEKMTTEITISTNSNEEKRGKFKDRDDVVNKTILRTIRRFFVSNYKEEYPQIRFRAANKRMFYFYNTLILYVSQLLRKLEGSDISENTTECMKKLKNKGFSNYNKALFTRQKVFLNQEILETVRLIGYLANKNYMQEIEKVMRVEETTDLLTFIELFKKCCSAYTHSLFNKLIKNVYFIRLFDLFCTFIKVSEEKDQEEDTAVENLRKFKVMSDKPQKYLEKIQTLKERMRQ
mmetsp:Transcript_1698/g.1493  ORF Transcript_1698/g.1493 Transcript_1698/m.1493 type:complete len:319 (-) Transcript_1698:30-986(-)